MLSDYRDGDAVHVATVVVGVGGFGYSLYAAGLGWPLFLVMFGAVAGGGIAGVLGRYRWAGVLLIVASLVAVLQGGARAIVYGATERIAVALLVLSIVSLWQGLWLARET